MKTLSLCLIVSFFLSACASKTTSTSRSPFPSQEEKQTSKGPEEAPDESVEGADSTEVGAPPVKREPRIALVLGGVGVPSWAAVGAFKKLEESEAKISCVVSAGWPTPFAVGHGFFRSIHDLEWFARRLEKGNFYRSKLLGFSKTYDQTALEQTLKKSLDERKALGQARVPLVIQVSFPSETSPSAYGSGAWLSPTLKTMNTPGIYRTLFDKDTDQNVPWEDNLVTLPVEEARKCEADFVIALDMYGDYLRWLSHQAKESQDDEGKLRMQYVSDFRKQLQSELGDADFSARIELKKEPLDFSAKLGAIRLGYDRMGELLKKARAADLPQN